MRPNRQMAGSWPVRHGERERAVKPITKLIFIISKVVDTPGFGNSLEEEEVSVQML